jgi:very-short-patch-repair endonuclease
MSKVIEGIKKENENAIKFLFLIKAYKIPKPQREFKFLQDRRFRFDFAWEEKKMAVEIEGGLWSGGRHTRGKGYLKDMEKYNLAVAKGWRVLRFSPDQISKEETYLLIKECLE